MPNWKIAILDFRTCALYVREVPKNLVGGDADDIMEHFAQVLNVSANDCQFMVGKMDIDIV